MENLFSNEPKDHKNPGEIQQKYNGVEARNIPVTSKLRDGASSFSYKTAL